VLFVSALCVGSLTGALLLAPQVSAETTRPRVNVVHVGNEGFLVNDGQSKVLIDALQGPGLRGYVTLPQEDRERLETAQPPFDGVSLILATHRHDDHFNPVSVGRYMQREREALFVSTTQAVERLRREFAGFAEIENRVRGLDPAEGQPVELEHAGIRVRVLDLHHGRGRDVDNLGFIFEIGGVRFLHVGDTMATPEEFARYGLSDLAIDVAMLPSWFVSDADWTDYEKTIGAGRVIAMHIPAEDAPPDYFAPRARSRGQLLEWLVRERRGVTLLWEPLQQESFSLEGRPVGEKKSPGQ